MPNNVNKLKGLNFDSSLSNIDVSVSSKEYRERLVSLLQSILDKVFQNNKAKQRIRVHKDRINFACPICGDSVRNNYKKRGNFILEGKFTNYYKCHNCGEFKRIDTFFKEFNITLDLSIINYIADNLEDFSYYEGDRYDISSFFDIELIDKYAIDREEFKKSFGLIEVKNSSVWPWLKYRLQYDDAKFMYNANKNYLVILNLTPIGKIIGVQKRNFKGQNKYLTYTLSKLYELLKMDAKGLPDHLDSLSQIFNITLLNYARPIILVEGPMDSFLIKNCIANLGAYKKFPIDIPVKYLYDKDLTGIKKSIQHINLGDEVFLWEKFLKDLNAPYRKKWDINDIFIWAHDHGIKIPNLLSYFSKDPLDIVDI